MIQDASSDARRRLFLSNFDFEAALVAPTATPAGEAVRRNGELAFAWLAVARPGDIILTGQLTGDEYQHRLESLGRSGVEFVRAADVRGRDFEVMPWGWDQRVLDWANSLNLPVNAPPLGAVAEANSRQFSFGLEREFGAGLAGQAACTSLGEVQDAAARVSRWLVKANFGAAGRERISGAGPPSGQASAWIEKRLRRDGAVFLEPFVDAIEEAGVQWEIPAPPAPPRLIGVAQLLSDERGQYRGSVITADAMAGPQWDAAIEVSRRAAERVQRIGYFGPLGIDAMRYRDVDGVVRLRALQDINARWTMGRLSLGWRDRLGTASRGVMRCTPAGDEENALRISPQRLDGKPLSHVLALELQCGEVAPA